MVTVVSPPERTQAGARRGRPVATISFAIAACTPATSRVSPSILVESTTGDGARDAEVNRILGVLERAASVLQAPDETTARRAGRLRYLAKTDDGIDALVAATAVGDGSPTVILTSDPDDLEQLVQRDGQVSVRAV